MPHWYQCVSNTRIQAIWFEIESTTRPDRRREKEPGGDPRWRSGWDRLGLSALGPKSEPARAGLESRPSLYELSWWPHPTVKRALFRSLANLKFKLYFKPINFIKNFTKICYLLNFQILNFFQKQFNVSTKCIRTSRPDHSAVATRSWLSWLRTGSCRPRGLSRQRLAVTECPFRLNVVGCSPIARLRIHWYTASDWRRSSSA